MRDELDGVRMQLAQNQCFDVLVGGHFGRQYLLRLIAEVTYRVTSVAFNLGSLN